MKRPLVRHRRSSWLRLEAQSSIVTNMALKLLRRGIGMTGKVIAGLSLALTLCVGTAVFAFEEQKADEAKKQGESAPAAAVSETTSSKPADDGTEVRIPGLGKLGVLPKMDFGLELLYGAADQKQPETTSGPAQTQDPDDLSIRGTVKHKF
jgi:hypothetical protein